MNSKSVLNPISFRSAAVPAAVIVTLIAVLLLVAESLTPSSTQTLQASTISHIGGNSYVTAVSLEPVRLGRLFEFKADNALRPFRSTLVVTEDGKPLTRPYAIVGDIEKLGMGRYSFWENPGSNALVFSATDNTDPRTNGRQYVVSARPVLLSFSFTFVFLLPVALLVLRHFYGLNVWMVSAVSAVALVMWGGIFFDRVIVAPDSTPYIQWTPIYPLGYPFFLSGIKAAFGTLGWTGVVQAAAMILACGFLALAARGLEIVALTLLLSCASSLWYAGWLLSEALFIPLALANLAAALLVISRPKPGYAIMMAVTAALAMFVRPAGYYLPVGIALLLLFASAERRRWLAKWSLLPLLLCIASTMTINYAVRGGSAQSQVGRVMFPNVAFLFEPHLVKDSKYQTYARVIDEAIEPHRAGYLDAASPDQRALYSIVNYNQRLIDMDEALMKVTREYRSEAFALRENIYLSFFLAIVTKRPLEYASLVIEQALYAWRAQVLAVYGPFRYEYYRLVGDLPQMLAQVTQFNLPLRQDETGLRGLPLSGVQQTYFGTLDRFYQLIRDQRWLVYLMGVVTLLAIPAALFARRSVYWVSLAYCGVMIHGSIFLTCATSVFIHRYAAPVDPVILVALVIAAGGAVKFAVGLAGLSRQAPGRAT